MRAPVHVSALPRGSAGAPLAVDVVPWRLGGKLNLTVVAKATLGMVHQGTARLEAPAELTRRDRHWEMNPARSLEAASDLAPYRLKADVTLFGHAYNPPGQPRPATSVRLGIFGQRPLFVKLVQVFGDRAAGSGPGGIQPFQRMPLLYEKALRTSDNPLGSDSPNLVDPRDRTQPIAFGPLSSYWLQRRRALGALSREALEADIIELPDGFDWSFFQAAPPDQQMPYLRGDEWIVLDGMHPALPRFQSRLPAATVTARVYGPAGGPGYPIEMMADGLAIDADRQICTVTWRRSFPVDSAAAATQLRILVALALPDEQIAWPELPPRDAVTMGTTPPNPRSGLARAPAPPPSSPARAEAKAPDFTGTQTIDAAALAAEALPFLSEREARAAGLPPPASTPERPAAPPPSSKGEETRGLDVASLKSALPFLGKDLLEGGSAGPSSSPSPTTIVDEGTAAPGSVASVTLPFVRAHPPPQAPAAAPPPAPPRPPAPPPVADMPVPPEEGTVQISLASILGGGGLPFGAPSPLPFTPPLNPAPPPQNPVSSGLPFAAPAAPPPPPPPSAPAYTPPPALPFAPPPPADAYAWAEAPRPAPAPAPPAQPAARRALGTVPTKPPPRITPEVPVTNRTPLVLWTLPWQVKPPQDVLVVVVKGTFDLDPDGPVRLRSAGDPPLGDVHLGDDQQKSVVYPSDFAIFKPKADVVLVGHAYPPGGLGPAARVTFRFGSGTNRFDRTLHVMGDRRWKPGLVANGLTDAAPFKKMPLVWERAFGGPRFDKNPVGAGHMAGAKDAVPPPLPNLEEPGKGITAPTDTPEPACFAPLSTAWKERWSKLGTYDARWLKTRWPYFPEDFDWAYFQSAPLQQRLDHLKGDEPFEIVGAQPQHAVIRGRLPGVRPRCFMHRTEEAGGGFDEVRLVLDTVTFEPDEMKVNLVWRGIIEVSEDEAPELSALFLMKEEAGEKAATLPQARERFLAALVPPEAIAVEPEDETTAAANDVPPPEREDDVVAAIAAEGKKREAKLAEAMAAFGEVPAAAPPPAPDPAAIAATLRAGGASEEDVERLLEALRPEPAEPVPPQDVRAKVVQKLQANAPLDGDDLSGADLSLLDFSGRSLKGANLKQARLTGAVFYRADLTGAQMSGSDLSDANLSEANLSGADLTGTALQRANLTGATVHQATFGAASAEGACFFGARGGKANFDGARLEKADFREAQLPAADFSGAELGGAAFEKASMEAVRLFGARAAGAKFDNAKMAGARADGGIFPAGSFKAVEAPESVWERADLTGATFQGAQLTGAGLSRIRGYGANFSGVELAEGKLRRAKLEGARFLRANLMSATFERADLTNADFRGANLHGAETLNAKMAGTKLDMAIVTKTKLKGRS